MSRQPDIDLESTAQAGRVSGGRSARIAALLVAGVLVTVVWIGMSGRSTPPPPQPTNLAVALEPTDAPPTTEPTPTATPAIGQEIPDGPVAEADEVFGVYAEFGFNQYITVLSEPEPGHLVGHLQMRLPIPDAKGIFVFEQLASRDLTGGPRFIGDWPISVETVSANGPDVLVLNVSPPARRSMLGSPTPVNRGFQLQVNARRDLANGELQIDVRIGPTRQIVGDDGLLGWPSVATMTAMQPTVDRPVVVVYDRSRGLYNRCRWDLSPISAPPRPGTDEASC